MNPIAPQLRIVALACALCALALAPARGDADIYVWTDAEGNVQMTEDLSDVPPAQRARALQEGTARSRRTPQVAPKNADEPAPAPAPRKKRAREGKSSAGRRHVLRIERGASEIRVDAVVDGVTVPFILDTGASICTLPSWAAEQMGIEIDGDTTFIGVTGVSGQVQRVPQVQIRSVMLGDAEVRDLNMAVMDTMEVGLLGMPFFNHFKVSTDPAQGLLVLEEIDLNTVSGMAGGQNEETWRKRFHARRSALESVRAKLERVPDEYVTVRENLRKQETYLANQLEQLEVEATRAGVPQEWRE